MSRIAILGCGAGGLKAALELRSMLSKEHEIIAIDKKDSYSIGFQNLWLMLGLRSKPKASNLKALNGKGIRFINEEIISIDPKDKMIKTKSHTINADYIIIALGAELSMDSIDGFSDALNLYDQHDAIRIYQRLKDFEKGEIAIVIASIPFKCPPAPYEAALLLDSYFKDKGIRDEVKISLYTPEPKPLAVAGEHVSNKVKTMLKEHDINYYPNHKIVKVDGKRLVFDKGIASCDLLIGIPKHVVPRVISKDMLNEDGWIAVDKYTLETRYEDVYAIGDVNSIRIVDKLSLPKAGTFAENEAMVVAKNIVNKINLKDSHARYDGYGYCYLAVDKSKAILGEGYFYKKPPEVILSNANEKFRREMDRFEEDRLRLLNP